MEWHVYFDDVEITELDLILLANHEHPLAAGTRDQVISIPGRPGAIDYGGELEPIPFNIPLSVIKKNRIEVQRTVRKIKSLIIDARGKPKTFKLKFGYEPDKYYNVRYSGLIPIERLISVGTFSLPLICYEGFARSVAKNDEVTWGSEEIPFDSDYTLGHAGSGAITLTSPGTTVLTASGANLRPVLYVEGSGEDVSISWDGKTMRLGTFSKANWVIDLKEYEVSKDGLNAIDTIKGDWLVMELEHGDNEIRIDGSGLDLSFRAEYQDSYF